MAWCEKCGQQLLPSGDSCDLCNEKGYVTSELEEDYVLSLNEDIIDFDD